MRLLLILLLSISFQSNAQLISGTLIQEGRKEAEAISFVQESHVNGFMIFELSVDREGKVTAVKLIESSTNSTPARVKVRNFLSTLKFEKGTHYPKFHDVRIKITLVAPKTN